MLVGPIRNVISCFPYQHHYDNAFHIELVPTHEYCVTLCTVAMVAIATDVLHLVKW